MPGKTEYTGLEKHGLKNLSRIYWHLPTPSLYEEAIRRNEGLLAHLGPLVVRTGHHTGRSPKDKFLVEDEITKKDIWWGGDNQPISKEKFELLYKRLTAYLQSKEVFVQECYVGAHPKYRKAVRIITETAWHALFARNMFIRELDPEKLEVFEPDFTLIHTPRFHAIPEIDGTKSETFIILNLTEKLILIGGTSYAGEIKKAVFTMMNYYLPKQGVLSMHCAANVGEKGDVALFFGLSGTGKTTLSTDPERKLIGDDEHGWCDEGIFNLEGGCYAKVIRLSKESEPDIYECTRKFGTILENVAIDPRTRRIDLNDDSLTENTRASYPITHLPRIVREGVAGHPKNIIFLTYDAFGVLPPVARLSKNQALYHFISGYTAKVAGTEVGVKEPKAVFSACYGAPFMVLSPVVYAKLLGEKIEKHNVKVWLVNTGLTGGPYGIGKRFSIKDTRRIIKAILNGELDNVPYRKDPIFKFDVPESCSDVPQEILFPHKTWPSEEDYWETAKKLATAFTKNIEKFKKDLPEEILAEGNPKVEGGA
ncbi:phosphoenolpyruvate carboxykinase (ATP) [Thermosulfidibacter takaii ABI70S6]|uniref:Phosphoenolpyruvate carboxykinase (ATP) n=1 Tax=Thermosulfidibacter takaii (strain DSM 17441 / JCM 13301 / NBRC 103674 / ABI70S6) TaxID=1298851 RepID=A0A0S3QU14_THET7|nr:phosphoenolpyruvate carboxykinase (ATP) [Thermosulfidibacter takaii]BAT71793.1 phosphoenolpyruvate carboxykinase (ATP) [Thermosulfidibacter takaii ABI70S6]